MRVQDQPAPSTRRGWWSLLAALLLSACSSQGDSESSAPHIVVIVADDLGWNDVSWHGSEIPTPTLDRLCSEGVDLQRFYVQPVCSPTRAAFLTGRYPIRYGMQIGVIRPWSNGGLPLEEETLAEILRGAGYQTALSGKWHLGSSDEEYLPMSRGFDSQYGHYTGSIDYWNHERLGGLDWHRNQVSLVEEGYATRLVARDAVQRIQAHDGAHPLFLYVPFFAPHFPLQAPAESVTAFAEIEDPSRRTYAAMVAELDRAVEKIARALRDRGMEENTLLLFFSDNGGFENQGASNDPLRGQKNQMYEGGVRVPAFVRWPSRLQAGQSFEGLLHVTDLLPTLATVAGAKVTGDFPLDGFDAWASLQEGRPSPRSEVLLGVEPRQGGLIYGRAKLVVHYPSRTPAAVAEDPLAGVELFEIDTDPEETRDLSREQPELAQRLLERLAAYRAEAVPSLEIHGQMPTDFQAPEIWGPQKEE